MSEALYREIIRHAFEAEGLPAAWGLAIARQESNFDANAQSMAAGDARRGGSFGLCQMSLATAQGDLGYLGDAEGLKNPEVNACLAARYVRMLCERMKTRDLKDIAAAYNSGKPFARAPRSTRNVYVPNVLAFAKIYEGTTS